MSDLMEKPTRPTSYRPRPRHIPLPEAQRRAPFTVLIPDRVPSDWELDCLFVEDPGCASAQAHVSLQYRSAGGHETVNLSQAAAADRPSVYDELIRGPGWHEVTRGRTLIHVTKPGAAGHQVQAHLERDKTFVFLMSETLTSEDLIELASCLVPAPSASEI